MLLSSWYIPVYTIGGEANFNAIAEALADAGYSDEAIAKVMVSNFFRVWGVNMSVNASTSSCYFTLSSTCTSWRRKRQVPSMSSHT